MHRLCDVLELRRAEIGDLEIEPLLHLPIGVLGKGDCARLSDAFEPSGDIDAIAHQVAVALFGNVAEMNADAVFDAPLRGRPRGLGGSGGRRISGYATIFRLPLAKIGIRPTSSQSSENEGAPGEARLAMKAKGGEKNPYLELAVTH